jgi:hypothetical protein
MPSSIAIIPRMALPSSSDAFLVFNVVLLFRIVFFFPLQGHFGGSKLCEYL